MDDASIVGSWIAAAAGLLIAAEGAPRERRVMRELAAELQLLAARFDKGESGGKSRPVREA